jgi:Tol biopolymer transport system component
MDEVKLTPLRKRNPRVSARVAAAIEKAMEPSQPNRFQTAEEFKRAIQGDEAARPDPAQLTTLPPSPVAAPLDATPPAEKKPQTKPRRRKSSPLSLAMLIAILFALGSVVGWMMQNPESAPESLRVFFPLPPSITPTITYTPTTQPTAIPSSPPTLTSIAIPEATETRPAEPTATPLVETPVPDETLSLPTETLAPTETATPAPTLVGGGRGEIAFVSKQGNTSQVFLASSDGSAISQLTNEMNGACQPSWSPDGMKLVFVSPCYEKSDLYPKSGLYIMDLETNEVKPLPSDPAGDFEPAWSPDGGKIAFTSLRGQNLMQIFSLNLNDLSVNQLTKSDGNVQSRQPAWSPDGKKIVYTVRRLGLMQIWDMFADGSIQEQLVRTGGSFSDYMPAWSPDGSFILFSQTNTDLTAPSSLQKFALGAETAELLVSVSLPVVDVGFSPDGNWIVYESSVNQNQDIYLYNLNTGERLRLTTSDAVDFDPAWRP